MKIQTTKDILPSHLESVISVYSLGTVKTIQNVFGMIEDNPKYIISTDQGQFVLKDRSDEEALKFEIAVLEHLKLKNIVAEEIIKARDGRSYVREREKFYVVFKFVEGKHPKYSLDKLTPEMVKEAGIALAGIHLALNNFNIAQYSRKNTGVFSVDKIPEVIRKIANFKAVLNKKDKKLFTNSDELFLKEYKLIQDQIQLLRNNLTKDIYLRLPRSIINGDFHPFNMFFVDSRVSGVIDWEGCHYGPRIIDLSHHYFHLLSLMQASKHDLGLNYKTQVIDQNFIDGYEQVLNKNSEQLNEEEIKYLPEALRYRLLQSIYARLLILFEYKGDEEKVYPTFKDQLMMLRMLNDKQSAIGAKRQKKYMFLMITKTFAGAEHFQMNYFRYINYEQYSVALGLKDDIFSPYLKKEELPVAIIKLPEIDKENDTFKVRFLKYYRFFKENKPDRVIFNQFWLESFGLPEIFAAFLVTKGNTGMIIHDCPPVTQDLKDRLLQTLLGYFTKSTLAVSKACKKALTHSFYFPPWAVKVIYHGVDVRKYNISKENKQELRRSFNIPISDQVIVSTAMLWPNKKVDRLLSAFNQIAKVRRDVHLIVSGTGHEHDSLMKLKDSFEDHIKSRIRFLGFCDDIPQILELSDIYVLPSDSEGLSLACMEAMASGLISVVSDCGGLPEIYTDGYDGFLVERNVEGLAGGLNKALDLSIKEKNQISLNARRTVEEKFNLDSNVHAGLEYFKITC